MENPIIYLLILLPLTGAIVCGYFGNRLGVRRTGIVASLAVFLAFAVGGVLFWDLLHLPSGYSFMWQRWFSWISSAYFDVGFDLLIDPLSICMVLVVTGVSFLIHVYSIGYMAHDGGFRRYFALLNLFVAAMLTLVLGRNLVVTFVGWEGVGLCSYALIGFWFSDEAKARAGKKAFIVNRIGDFGFLIAMFLIFSRFHTLDYIGLRGLFSGTSGLSLDDTSLWWVSTAAVFLLFMGAMGKSAQIPLHVWLPDAMAGPTPVSALIHAATMVTAGVYLISRISFMKPFAEPAFLFIAALGALTAFVAATIAVAQRDIKKILAYSTVSQLGYMFLACGIGASIAGMFHLATHACFKALLFLGAGSVIHAMHEEQDIFEMGGLAKDIPVTCVTMAIAVIAISGIPPFSGFVSKDEILFMTWVSGHPFLYSVGILTALLTAFYMGRLFFYTFFGKKRGKAAKLESIHECPPTMMVVLIVLAALSMVVGLIAWPETLGGHNMFHHFLSGTIFENAVSHEVLSSIGKTLASASRVLAIFSSVVAAIGLLAAYEWVLWLSGNRKLSLLARVRAAHALVWNKYYVDEIYDYVIVSPLRWLATCFYEITDLRGIDGAVNETARMIDQGGRLTRRLQNGILHFYGLVILIGSLCIIVYFLTV